MFTAHVSLLTTSQPVHPVKTEPSAGVAFRITVVLITKSAEHAVPQLTPDGVDVTVPFPMPVLAAVSLKRFSMKIAVTDLGFVIDTVQVEPDTESHPVHPIKFESTPAVADITTCESLMNDAEHAEPQVIPAGFDVTVPVPSPCRSAASDSICLTVTAAVPLLPNESVPVIVATPRLTAVTRPLLLTDATPGLLDTHVMPVPVIVTALRELLTVPSPNSPKSFSPQHRTDASRVSTHV